MRTQGARWAIVLGAALGGIGLMVACTGGDDTVAGKTNPNNPQEGQDATTADGPADLPDTLLPPGAPLCTKYPNGTALVAKITSDLVNSVGADCRISAHFVSPTLGAAHLSQCLQTQIGAYFQCPGVTYDGSKDSAGKTCRSMADAHKNMNLRTADFDAFIADLVAVFKANGISNDDISLVLPTFTGTKSSIVLNQKGIGNSMCTCANNIGPDGKYCGTDAGTDASDGGDGGTIPDASDDGG